MTIAAGVLCSDGIVLCADSEHTGMTKQSGQKIWVTTEPQPGSDLCVALAAAGESLLIRAVRDRMSEAVNPGMTRHDALESIEHELEEFYRDHMYNHPGYPASRQLQILIALRDSAGLSLLQSSDHSFGPVDTSACLGQGTELGEYLLDAMVESVLTPGRKSITGNVPPAVEIQRRLR